MSFNTATIALTAFDYLKFEDLDLAIKVRDWYDDLIYRYNLDKEEYKLVIQLMTSIQYKHEILDIYNMDPTAFESRYGFKK